MKNLEKNIFFVFLVGLLLPNILFAYEKREVVINEFSPQPISGLSWLEFRNSSSTEINLNNWQLGHFAEIGTTTLTMTTLGDIELPPGGLATFDYNLGTTSDVIVLFDDNSKQIDAISYGGVDWVASNSLFVTPVLGQSGIVLSNGPLERTDNPSRGWFNIDPTELSIIDNLPAGISSNLGSNSNWSVFTDLTFEKTGKGKIIIPGTYNLTGDTEVTTLQNLNTNLDLGLGYIKFVADSQSFLASNSAQITMFGLPTDKNYVVSDLVKPDGAVISDFIYSTTSDNGTVSFTTDRLGIFSVATTTPIVENPTPSNPPSGGGGGGGGGSGSSASVATSTLPEGRVLGENIFRFTRYLRQGMRGNDVQELQKRLKLEGFFLGETTKYFGPVTKKAVVAYQKKHKIKPVTGVVAKATIAKLNLAPSLSLAKK